MFHTAEHNYQLLVAEIRQVYKESGKECVVVTLSGEISSAIVLCLAVDALGKECIHCLMMPSHFSTVHSITDSVQLAEQVEVPYHIIPIDSIYHKFLKELSPVFGNTPSEPTRENLHTHIRSALLMAYANQKECLLLLHTTLKGLKDLHETEVYELVNLLNNEKPRIPLWR